jgi:hypothetical protein
LACGCGGGVAYDVVPVSGKVTLDGQPLAGVDVSFQPTGSRPGSAVPGSTGITDAQGNYKLTIVGETEKEGAVPGKHIVRLSKAAGGAADADAGYAEEESGTALPPESADGSLTFDVPAGGTDKADFDLKSK